MSDQPEALFLADVIENDPQSKAHHDAAAACLRRLHAEIETLRTRLAEPEPKNDLPPMPDPVAWQVIDRLGKERNAPLFAEWQMRSYARVAIDLTAPPTRRPLTDEEIDAMWRVACEKHSLGTTGELVRAFARTIERKITGGNDE